MINSGDDDVIEQLTKEQIKQFKLNKRANQKKVIKKNDISSQPEVPPFKSKSRRNQEQRQFESNKNIYTFINQNKYNEIKADDLHGFGVSRFIRRKISKSQFGEISKSAKEILRTGVTWWICNSAYNEEKWKQIFARMYDSEIRDLRMANNSNPSILKEISHVNFTNLELLFLYSNKIDNIEPLSKMRFPHLRDLGLRENCISSIRSLRKCQIIKIEILSISILQVMTDDNYINQLQELACLEEVILHEIFLEWTTSRVMGEDMSWMMKLNSEKQSLLNKILIQSQKRMKQTKQDQMLAHKFTSDIDTLIKRKSTP